LNLYILYILYILPFPTGIFFNTTTYDLLSYVVFPEDGNKIRRKHLEFTFESKLVQ